MYDLQDVVSFPNDTREQITKNGYWTGKLTIKVGLPVESVHVGRGDYYQVKFLYSGKRVNSDIGLDYVSAGGFALCGQLQQHPACCGSVFLSCLYNYDHYSLNGKSIPLTDVVGAWVKMAEEMGFSTIQYIVAGGQNHIKNALEKLGWKPIHKVKNKRSNNSLTFYQFDLSPSR